MLLFVLNSSYLRCLYEWSYANISYYSPNVCPYSSKEKATVGVQFNEMLIEQWVECKYKCSGGCAEFSCQKNCENAELSELNQKLKEKFLFSGEGVTK